MTIRERILAALYRQEPDMVPLTVYESLLPRGERERELRKAGVGLVIRPPAHLVSHRNVEIINREYWENGLLRIRRTIRTPVGEIWQTLEPDVTAYSGSNTWIHEHFIKGPEDYKVMEYYIRDGQNRDNYACLEEAKRCVGEDGIVYVRMGRSPIQAILYEMMGTERFSLHLYDYPELIDSLNETMCQKDEELYEIAAGAPVEVLVLVDNITADMVGVDRFKKYLVPVYKRIKEWLVGSNKLLGSHMDGALTALSEVIADTDLDIIEAFTPPPMGDLSIRKAREAWPGKALWINYTSSVHLQPPEVIEAHTRELLEQAGGKKGFAISVTENAPVEALERSLGVIAAVLRDSR
jgi:hypothetical protein